VLCQHGLQFFPDRPGALSEMHRVREPGGVAVVSTWAAERPPGTVGPMCCAFREAGVRAPDPRAFDAESYVLGVSELSTIWCPEQGSAI
jgi:ubiquinone/menaquinone biosynthesis C-methylase UbiE